MNSNVRSYLIEAARTKDKFVFYSDIVRDCKLPIDLKLPSDHEKFSKILGDVSKFEHENNRPLITSLAIYKSSTINDHGTGFYKLASELGFGTVKVLQERLFAFEEAERSRAFWQNTNNFNEFGGTEQKNHLAFFTREELEFFKSWQLKAYDPKVQEHVDAKNYLMDTVWSKTKYLGEQVIERLDGFGLDARKAWSQRGWKDGDDGVKVQAAIIKPYTWIKIFRDTDKGKDIFFTFGVDVHPETEGFVFKIDCQNKRDSKLTQEQIDLCKSLIPQEAVWNEIPFDSFLSLNWQSLIDVCVSFIKKFLERYDLIIDAVWGKALAPNQFKNTLVKRDKPVDGLEEFPVQKPTFKGFDTDHLGVAKELKELGDKGEALVKDREITFLRQNGMIKEAEQVEIVKDGMGFDVLSFDLNGNKKYIEVKTTTGSPYSAFFLSSNELAFMRENLNTYAIYRIYNYDEENNFGEFFEVEGQVEIQLLMAPTEYKVLIKGSKKNLS